MQKKKKPNRGQKATRMMGGKGGEKEGEMSKRVKAGWGCGCVRGDGPLLVYGTNRKGNIRKGGNSKIGSYHEMRGVKLCV